ncbi:MAG: AMP-binding protein [Alphaproteobacteria bacterium]
MSIYDTRFETADRDVILAYQLERIKTLIEKTWATNDFYRSHWSCSSVDIEKINSLEAFSDMIPVVEKKDFITDQDNDPPFGRRHAHLLSLGVPYTIFITGGTTGQGVEVHLQSNDDIKGMEEIYRYQFTWAGIEPGTHTFLMLPMTMMGGGRIEYIGAVAYGLSVSTVGNYDAARKLELLQRFRPKAIIANTSYFGHLAAVSGEQPPLDGLTHLFTGGEGSGHAYLERIEQQWQATISDHYGNTQMGNDHMFTCEHGIGPGSRPGLLHNVEPLVYFEVIDPDTGRHVRDGEMGELILTNLYRLDGPAIRCRVNDRAVYHEGRYCPCGRSFAGVEVATISRGDDMKKVKNVNIWPQAVENVLFAEPEVDDFEILLASSAQEADTATARIMPREALEEGDEQALADRLGKALQKRVGIRFVVEIIPPGSLARGDLKVRRWKDERLHSV